MAQSNSSQPSRDTLDRAPTRALSFLLGVGRSPVIRGLLETRGYTTPEHRRGWELLRAVDPTHAGAAMDTPAPPQSDATVREAIARLDSWDNENLPIAEVALRRRHPTVHSYLFAGALAPADGPLSIPVIITFLDRLDTLEAVEAPHTGHHRRAHGDAAPVPDSITASHARAALGLLATRGITPASRAEVRSWLATVQTGTAGAAPRTESPASATGDAALAELRDWIDEWTTVAKRVVKRRDQLIAIGIGTRKKRKSDGETGSTPTGGST